MAASTNETERVGKRERASRDDRAELAERVSEDDDRFSELARLLFGGAEGGDRRYEKRGLRIRGPIELGLRSFEAEPPQVEAERLVRLGEHARRARVRVGELLSHADGLRALSRKEPGDGH